MHWFKHDTDARNSLKLRKVRRKYGADGYAIYWFCLEAIAYNVDKTNLTFELKEDAETIAFELSIQEKRVEEIMMYMIEIGLFESSHGTITCLKLAERLDKSMTNSPVLRKWIGEKNVMTSADGVMTSADSVRECHELELELELDKIRINTTSTQSVAPMNYQAIQDSFNEHLTKASKVLKMTDKRKRIIKKFFREFDLDMQKWTNYIEYINNSPDCAWMFEVRDRGNGQVWQPKGFEFIASEACYLKVKEQYS